MFRYANVVALAAATTAVFGCQRGPDSTHAMSSSQPSAPSSAAPVQPPVVEDVPAPVERHPVVVLYERDPWGSVIGAEIPSFVLYEDGLAIYLHERDRGADIRQVELLPERVAEIQKQVFEALDGAPRDVSIATATDQPTVEMMARVGDIWRKTRIYGMESTGQSSHPSPIRPNPLAPAVAETYVSLRSFATADAVKWEPERLEVMMGSFPKPQEEVDWPSGLPTPPAGLSPNQEFRVKKFEISAKHGPALGQLMKSLGNKRAVEWNGFTWSVQVRPVIAGEDEIRAAM